MSNTFVSVNDAVLVDTIGQAENRLVFIAMGLRHPIPRVICPQFLSGVSFETCSSTLEP